MNTIAREILTHYGMPRRSGRYPYGSGDNPYQRSGDFLSRIEELKKEGKTDKDIYELMGLKSSEYRIQKALANDERRSLLVSQAKALKDKGYSLKEITRRMGYSSDSSVRSLLDERAEGRMNQARNTADILKKEIDKKGMIDVGIGVEKELNISSEMKKQALYLLEMEGYPVYGGRRSQITNPGKKTTLLIACPPGTEHKEIFNAENVHSLKDYISYDGGYTYKKPFVYPKSMDSNRIKINYAEEGGDKEDGLIYIRRNVEDLSLGKAHYAQVRILVDNDKYLKGMAVYSDNMPDGIDVIFNTNKKIGTDKSKVFKSISNDPNNPFGSLIKEKGGQSYYLDKNGVDQLSLINKRAEEGDWKDWSNKLASQFLSKQNKALIDKQLNLTIADKMEEFDEIRSYTNPTIKKILLNSFADDCDAAAVHLKATALPRQQYHVILPITTMKDNEVYAPNYENGEKLALVRFPHGGTFEIPILTVNNKQQDAKKILENSIDAIGINSQVASRLSGADFDGDAVMTIPITNKIKISHEPPLKELEGFDVKLEYPYREGMKKMTNTQNEMGKITNLITDMTLKGATKEELAKAVKHSMVVIDAENHNLNYKQSEIDNNISALKTRYQEGGASTLLSRAKSRTTIIKRRGSPKINPQTGELEWKETENPTYVDEKGKIKTKTQRSTKMAETKDARTLSSGTPQEEAYAIYANKMKAMANEARKEMITTKKIQYSPSAKAVYQQEVNSLLAQLNIALKNAPRERQAQGLAGVAVADRIKGIKDIKKKELKKLNQQAITATRITVGAQRHPIKISDREWEAIQAGAISENMLIKIIKNANIDELKVRATPRATTNLSAAKINKISSMNSSGYTIKEIAKAINVSTSTVSKYLKN